MGLSATPSRNDEGETKDLLDLFNKNYAGIKISEKYNVIEYLQNQGVLCLLKTEPIVTNLKFDLTKTEKNYLNNNLDFSPPFLDRIAKSELRNAEIVIRTVKEIKKNKKIIIFACNVDHSDFLNSV